MIFLDLSQLAYSNLIVQMKILGDKFTQDNFMKTTYQAISNIVNKFSGDYGSLIICRDGHRDHYWRHDIFPHYKYGRVNPLASSGHDREAVVTILNTTFDVLRDNTNLAVVMVREAEADDVIAVLTKIHAVNEPCLIVSADKDFIQLHTNKNVRQYAAIQKKWVEHPHPLKYKKEHILRGDRVTGFRIF